MSTPQSFVFLRCNVFDLLVKEVPDEVLNGLGTMALLHALTRQIAPAEVA